MANTKALTRGLYSLRSEQVSDLMQNVGFRFTTEAPTNFVVACQKNATNFLQSITHQVLIYKAVMSLMTRVGSPREAENSSAMDTPGDKWYREAGLFGF
jgi:hypothetical protein